MDVEIHILDAADCPAAPFCDLLTVGDFKNYDDVLNFGRKVDVLTVEIEHINIEALWVLAAEGIEINPSIFSLEIIRNKSLQKTFYKQHKFRSGAFFMSKNRPSLPIEAYPCVWKASVGGYDGKGVSFLRNADDLALMPDVPCIIEKVVKIKKELSVIVARNRLGEIAVYPAVEMVFDKETHMLDYQMCPADISRKTALKAQWIAMELIEKLDICGLLAVEFFLTTNGTLFINESAPRPHNSGHHTIEAFATSQFEQHLRCILNLPLGSTFMKSPSVLLNLVGEAGYEGKIYVEGLEIAENTEGVYVHLYGKKITKPFRKMGHVTILNQHVEKCLAIALRLKDILKIKSL